jgi:hypothetical protein
MISQKVFTVVTPAEAGVQKFLDFLDSRFHGNDGKGAFSGFLQDHQSLPYPSFGKRGEGRFATLSFTEILFS